VYSILIKYSIPAKLVRLTKTCTNKTQSVQVQILSDASPVQNGLKQGNSFLLLLSKFYLKFPPGKVQENQEGMKLNGKHQLLVYADDNSLG
jgi:hypothetical protein